MCFFAGIYNFFRTSRLITFFTTTEKREKSEGSAIFTLFMTSTPCLWQGVDRKKRKKGGALTLLCGGKKGD